MLERRLQAPDLRAVGESPLHTGQLEQHLGLLVADALAGGPAQQPGRVLRPAAVQQLLGRAPERVDHPRVRARLAAQQVIGRAAEVRRLRVHPRASRRRDRRVERAGEQRRADRAALEQAGVAQRVAGRRGLVGFEAGERGRLVQRGLAAEHDDRAGQRAALRRQRVELALGVGGDARRRRGREPGLAFTGLVHARPPRGDGELVDEQRPAARRAVAGGGEARVDRVAELDVQQRRHRPLAQAAACAARSRRAGSRGARRRARRARSGAAGARRTRATRASRGRRGADRRSPPARAPALASRRLSSTKRS